MNGAISGLKHLAQLNLAKGEVPGLSIAIVCRDEVIYLGRRPNRSGGAALGVRRGVTLESFNSHGGGTLIQKYVESGLRERGRRGLR